MSQTVSWYQAASICSADQDMRNRVAACLARQRALDYTVPEGDPYELSIKTKWEWATEFQDTWKDYVTPDPDDGEPIGVLAVPDTDIKDWVQAEYPLA